MLVEILKKIGEFCSLQTPKDAVQNKRKAGFTLIELMVVIIIVNLLSGVAVPKLTDMIERTRQRLDVMKLYYLRDALNRALYESEYDNINEGTYGSCGTVTKAKLDTALKYGMALFIIQRSSYMPANYQGVHSSAKTIRKQCSVMRLLTWLPWLQMQRR